MTNTHVLRSVSSRVRLPEFIYILALPLTVFVTMATLCPSMKWDSGGAVSLDSHED